MPPTEIERAQVDALGALAEQDVEGPRNRRGEFACDEVMDRAIVSVTDEMGSRSKAIRALIKEGAKSRAARLNRRLARRGDEA